MSRGHRSYERSSRPPAGCLAGFQEPSCRTALGCLWDNRSYPAVPPMNMIRKRKNAILIQTTGLSVKGFGGAPERACPQSGKKQRSGKTVAGNLFTRGC